MPAPSPIVSARQITVIHLKSQALVNLFFGLPMLIAVTPFWGLPVSAAVKIIGMYLAFYVLVYIPLWFLLPRLLLRPINKSLERVATRQVISPREAKNLAEYLLGYPLRSAIIQFFLILALVVIASISILPMGIISEIMPILPLSILYLVVVGLVLSTVEAFLNFTLIENRLNVAVAKVVALHPKIVLERFQTYHVSLLSKMLFVILGTVVAAQLILFTLTVGKMSLSAPAEVWPTVIYLGAFMGLTIGYVVVAASIFTRNISWPLNQLIAWSERVAKGERGNLPLVTNDEISEVVRYSNAMVQSLNSLSQWLERERDQLAVEKDKLAVILARVADGVVATNAKGKVILFNEAMEKLTGYKEDEVMGKALADLIPLFRDSGRPYPLAKYLEVRPPAAGSRTRTRYADLRLVTKRQQDRYVSLSATTMDGAMGAELGWILTFHDVTEERELERMKLDFVSMAAHELRTPLTAIRGYLSLLGTEMGDKLTKEELLFLNRSLIGSNHLAALIENLLNVSKIEHGALKVELAPMSINRVIQDVLTTIGEVARQKKISIDFSPVEPESRLVLADYIRLGEVVSNLLANAINYSPMKSKVAIVVDCQPEANRMVVTVTDHGEGIPAQALPHMFTKFYRVSGELSQGSKGTGLGLYISKAIIEAHHGTISVDSQLGKGSTFTFSVPLAPPEAKEAVFFSPHMIKPIPAKHSSTNQIKSL